MEIAYENSGSPQYTIRPLYILPFFANFVIIASAAALCGYIGDWDYDESAFPIPHWIFFASSAVFAPTIIAVCKLLPDPSYSVCIGGLFTVTGLLSTALVSDHQQMFTFGIPVGVGVTLSLTSTSMSLAPYFVQRSLRCAVCLLVAAAVLAISFHSITVHLVTVFGNRTFLILSPFLLITSVIPFIIQTCFKKRLQLTDQSCSMRPSFLLDEEKADQLNEDSDCDLLDRQLSACENVKRRCRSSPFANGWLLSFMSVIVWLFWGAGVDSSWLAMVWDSSISSGQNVVLIQLLFSMMVLVIKILTEPKRTSSSRSSASSPSIERRVFACNYMYLGLLGVGGLLLALFPYLVIPLHNQLIFTMGLALQFDDLCDLDVQNKSAMKQAKILNGTTLQQLDKLEPKHSKLDLCCLICHLMSLFMMSCLAMLLGLQLSNATTYIFSLPPLSYMCSTAGLCCVSAISLAICLFQPDYWIS